MTTTGDTGGNTADTAGGGGEGRELIIAHDMDLTTLDPSRAYCDTRQIYLSAVYQTLIGVDPADVTKLLPRLATEWESNADNVDDALEATDVAFAAVASARYV